MLAFAMSDVTSAISNVLTVLSSIFEFIVGNPLLLILICAPVVLGLLYAFMSVFRK